MSDFDYDQYLVLADWISGQKSQPEPDEQTRFRCTASKAYYAAHHCCLRFLKATNNEPGAKARGSGGDHQAVIERFRRMQGSLAPQVVEALEYLIEKRVDADYYPEASFSQDAVKAMLKYAHNVLGVMPYLHKKPPDLK